MDKAAKEAKDKVAKDKVAKDKVAKDKVAKDMVAKDKVAKDKVLNMVLYVVHVQFANNNCRLTTRWLYLQQQSRLARGRNMGKLND